MAATSENVRKSLSIRNSQCNDGDRKINGKQHNSKRSAIVDLAQSAVRDPYLSFGKISEGFQEAVASEFRPVGSVGVSQR